MKKLINTQDVKETMFREEKELAKMFFDTKEYPIGFITGVQDSMNIANTVYRSTPYLIVVIAELATRILDMDDSTIKCGYYFIMSYLHYMNDEKMLALIASHCIKSCYKAVSDNG
nr:MAG TPA: hypothetical protein [Caudoviricetes sp.]